MCGLFIFLERCCNQSSSSLLANSLGSPDSSISTEWHFPTLICPTFGPPSGLQRMSYWLWIRILQEGVPTSPSNHFIPNVRIHNLKPCARGVILMPGDLSIPQLFEAVTPTRGAASVRAQEEIKAIEGVFVGSTFALDELVELRVGLDMSELERHWEGDFLLR